MSRFISTKQKQKVNNCFSCFYSHDQQKTNLMEKQLFLLYGKYYIIDDDEKKQCHLVLTYYNNYSSKNASNRQGKIAPP